MSEENQHGTFSDFFINRPRFAAVISIVFFLAGLISIYMVPVAQFPQISPPQVSVTTYYPGSSAEVIEGTIAAPIEEQVNGVENMLYMESISDNSGQYTLTVTFAVGTDPDIDAINVQNRVQLALPRLPEEVQRQGVSVMKQSPDFLLVISVFSPEEAYSSLYLSNFTSINVLDPIKRVNGVGNASIFGPEDYSMRIWLDPDRLTSLGLSPQNVIDAIRNENLQASVGQIGAPPLIKEQQFQYTLQAKGRLKTPKEFGAIIVRAGDDASLVRVSDIARVELGQQTYTSYSKRNGKQSIQLAVYQTPGANALETVDGVLKTMERVAKTFPPGIEYEVIYDTTLFVKATIWEVVKTLGMTFCIVVIVTYLFLGDLRATMIPTLAIPVSLVGAFIFFSFFGMTINTVTLFAIVLAIGLVVDDAIVVVENVQRLIEEEGLLPKDAAHKAMRQVTSPVISTSLVLFSIFVPVAFLPGITGELYKQFAVTLSLTVLISTIVALTLSPAVASLVLKPKQKGAKQHRFIKWIYKTRDGYGTLLSHIVTKWGLTVCIVLVAFVLFGLLYPRVPKGFLPNEDQGVIFINIQTPGSSSLNQTEIAIEDVEKILQDYPDIQDYITVTGFSLITGVTSANAGLVVAVMKPWDQRKNSHFFRFLTQLQGRLQQINNSQVFAFIPPAIRGLGKTGGFDYRLEDLRGQPPEELAKVLQKLLIKANQDPVLENVFSTFNANLPQLYLNVDTDKAYSLKVPVSSIYDALQANLGTFYVNDFNMLGRVYQVNMMAKTPFRESIEDITRLYVKSNNDNMVRLSSLITIDPIVTAQYISRYNLFRSASVNGDSAKGYSSGTAIEQMAELSKEMLPAGYSYEWSSLSYQEVTTTGQTYWIIIFAFVFAYLFLVANYESWIIPMSVIFSVCFALVGAVLGLYLMGATSNIYAQIGMLLLIGLASKNAILIVEFCKDQRAEGKSLYDSALIGAKQRFRAVLMTAFSFIFGVTPLLMATGAGALSRRSIGLTVFSGMLVATVVGIIFIPGLYFFFEMIREWLHKKILKEEISENETLS